MAKYLKKFEFLFIRKQQQQPQQSLWKNVNHSNSITIRSQLMTIVLLILIIIVITLLILSSSMYFIDHHRLNYSIIPIGKYLRQKTLCDFISFFFVCFTSIKQKCMCMCERERERRKIGKKQIRKPKKKRKVNFTNIHSSKTTIITIIACSAEIDYDNPIQRK